MELFNLFLGNVSEGKRGEKKPEQNCVVPTSLVAQMVKCLSTMRETWVLSLGREDPLEKEMAIPLPGKSHGQRSLVGYSL